MTGDGTRMEEQIASGDIDHVTQWERDQYVEML